MPGKNVAPDTRRREANLAKDAVSGDDWYVAKDGADSNDGRSFSTAKLTVQAAVDAAAAGDTIHVGPGDYDEQVTVGNSKTKLTIRGAGTRLSTAIAPQTGNKRALTVNADDVTLINLDLAGQGTLGGLKNTGRRLHAVRCKFEGGTDACIMSMGSVAEINAGSAENGSDWLLEDCEYAWATNGLVIENSDYGANTQGHAKGGVFHNLTGAHVKERNVAGGTASILYRNLELVELRHQDAEDGTQPTKYYDLAGSNVNTGDAFGCYLPVALASGGKTTVSTLLKWSGVRHTGGLSTGQPS